jgi:hypothetical protein
MRHRSGAGSASRTLFKPRPASERRIDAKRLIKRSVKAQARHDCATLRREENKKKPGRL